MIFEFIFFDGNHRFDDALVDFTLSAEVCPLDGYVVLDDMWMPSIQRTASFIRRNREDFVEATTPIANFAAFERTYKDTPAWDQHIDF